MGSEHGVSEEKLIAVLGDYAESPLFAEDEKVALEVADAMTITGQDVSDELFERLQTLFSADEITELVMTIAWENSSSKFNRALRVPTQNLWKVSS